MKKNVVITVFFFFLQAPLFAQWYCEKVPAIGGENIENSNGIIDAVIIGIAVIIVLFTLIMSVKYLFKPGENNSDHIKNIVKNEGF